ncbi:MAG TPA: PilC/PilY family type IV pilus protein [Steroidobacteraceae bacterium]|nr:PilC/PilY family type IV pilus protein [Steroidobacteraceae bacterium]
MHKKTPAYATLLGLALALFGGAPVFADDSEIYVNSTSAVSNVKPNILLVVDTSYSMAENDIHNERNRYNPGSNYGTADNCQSGRIFFRADGAPMPTCTSNDYILTTQNNCDKLAQATGSSGKSGRWTGKTAQWNDTTLVWSDLQPGGVAQPVECYADNNVHGQYGSSATTKKFARNGDSSNKWTNLATDVIAWTARTTYTFYSSNYLRYLATEPANKDRTRIGVAQDAIVDLVSSVDDLNMGMMRFNIADSDGDFNDDVHFTGGLVTNKVEDITTGRANLIARVLSGSDGFFGGDGYGANSATMLSETLYEAKRYWAGQTSFSGRQKGAYSSSNQYGYDSGAFDTSSPAKYISPITNQCQRNFTVILTDGVPTWDHEADSSIEGTGKLVSACDGTGDGRCLDDLAGWMNSNDVSTNTSLAGNQTVQTYVIAYAADLNTNTDAWNFMQSVASEGGGQAYTAQNSDDLQEVFTNITNQVLNVGTTFSTASVSVNAFNRTASRSELYYSVFAPLDRYRWDGNLKKYKLTPYDPDGSTGPLPVQLRITDRDGNPAIDSSTGLFADSAKSFWGTSVTDGNRVTQGGAANQLPAATARKIYTFTGANPAGTLTALTELKSLTSTQQDSNFGTTASTSPTTAEVLAFAYATDEKRMGDPLHSQPAVVTFSGTSASPVDTVYVATNDGYLHAINAADGVEKWAFVPGELLGRLKDLDANAYATNRVYGLDGDVRVLKLDKDNDGLVEKSDGDRVYLFVGMRRGGQYYYAFDVTDNDANPKLMWKAGPSELPGIGETWSPPTVARVNVGGSVTQNNQKLVLIFGGGYDAAEEGVNPVADDPTGNRIFMVDARFGTLLWYAGNYPDTAPADSRRMPKTSGTTTNSIVNMRNAIPGRISVIDIDGDQLADRMYAADLGGRLWRFDITNGNPAASLVSGGVFAELGQTGVATPTVADTRRFYNAPDVALIKHDGLAPYYNLAIGSGYRGHPLNTQTTDRIYAVRDFAPFTNFSQSAYNTTASIKEGDLVNMSVSTNSVSETSKGWRRTLPNSGEKVLSEVTTAGSTMMFTTYQPVTPAANSCAQGHRNRVYAINLDTGKAALDLDSTNNTSGNTVINDSDISQVLDDTSGITGEVRVAAMRGLLEGDLDGDGDVDADDERIKRDRDDEAVCLAGRQILNRCVAFDDAVRTYWRRDADAGQ